MKKTLHILCLCLVSYFAKAQQSQHQLFVGNAAVDYKQNPSGTGLHMQVQIGSPFIGANLGIPYIKAGSLKINSPGSIAAEYPYTITTSFGGALNRSITGDIVIAIDSEAPTSDGCTVFTNAAALNGKIAIIFKGNCSFVDKIKNAQNAGAIAVIIRNNSGGLFEITGEDAAITIPSAAVSWETGRLIMTELASGGVVNATLQPDQILQSTPLNSKVHIGFPYGILYIAPTFVVDGFEVSKGYYSDRVNIKWEFGANQNLIEKINIYRKELGGTTSYQFIGSVSKDVFEYNDSSFAGQYPLKTKRKRIKKVAFLFL